jgi:hypothetical protein
MATPIEDDPLKALFIDDTAGTEGPWRPLLHQEFELDASDLQTEAQHDHGQFQAESIDPYTVNDPEHPATLPTEKSSWRAKKKKILTMAAIGLAATAGVIGFSIKSIGSEEDSSASPTVSSPPAVEDVHEIMPKPDIYNMKEVLPNSDDPQQLLEQLLSNQQTALNAAVANDFELSQKSLDLFVSNTRTGGYIDAVKAEVARMPEYAASSPGYIGSVIVGKVIDSDFSDPEKRIIKAESTWYHGEGYSVDNYRFEYTLQKFYVPVDGFELEQPVWLIVSHEPLL